MTANIRRDPISGRLVAIAPGRSRRPGASSAQVEPETAEELEQCPFDAGREDRTPPETLRLGDGPSGWRVRVVPNLYPALERQEVVIHTPEHKRSFAELNDEEIGDVAEVVRGTDAFWLVNEGRAAGSSLPHTHSQLAYGLEPPKENAAGVAEVLAVEGLLVAQRDDERCVVHVAGRLPYEMLISGGDLHAALLLLRESISRLRKVEGPVPWNAWLHRGDAPHIEVLPRLTVMAGIELGAGVYVNSLDPAEAADRLQSA